jgi:hypothetical protein
LKKEKEYRKAAGAKDESTKRLHPLARMGWTHSNKWFWALARNCIFRGGGEIRPNLLRKMTKVFGDNNHNELKDVDSRYHKLSARGPLVWFLWSLILCSSADGGGWPK